jgi:2-polyprenyl-3-methyl-5-hydroxy-6-metoxy-1,4-benzoquinol methylase
MVHRVVRGVYFMNRGVKEERMRMFVDLFAPMDRPFVLDVGAGGGELWNWFTPEDVKKGIRLVGLDREVIERKDAPRPWASFVVADATALPFRAGSVDIVFSNSALEHVGGHEQQRKMVNEILRVSRSFFLQVPNKHFPIEPHFFVPFMQYLPIFLQQKLTAWAFGFDEPIHLPTRRSLSRLFPADCHIGREKFLGLTKSFLVWRLKPNAAEDRT